MIAYDQRNLAGLSPPLRCRLPVCSRFRSGRQPSDLSWRRRLSGARLASKSARSMTAETSPPTLAHFLPRYLHRRQAAAGDRSRGPLPRTIGRALPPVVKGPSSFAAKSPATAVSLFAARRKPRGRSALRPGQAPTDAPASPTSPATKRLFFEVLPTE